MKVRNEFYGKARGRLVTRLMARDGTQCALCGGDLSKKEPAESPRYITFDHKIPISLGGSDSIRNLQLAHRDCNEARGDAYDPAVHV